MKRIFLVCAACCSLATVFAQGPYYLLFNLACMDQLEYRSAYSGNSTLSFNFRPSANEQYILTGGTGGITAATMPKGVRDCRDVVLDDGLVESVNNLTKQMYIVQQTQQGYVLTPIISITHITRSGTYYIFRANMYSFALDTTRLMYGANMASVGSPSAVYFTALKGIYNCRFQYSFRREPTRPNMEKSEFDFIPGIGIVSDKPGLTATEAETNQIRLWSVNGRPLDEYLSALCGRQPGANTGGVPQYTGPAYPQSDKEEASINYGEGYNPNYGSGTGPKQPGVNPQTGLANCPELPGRGYHIVQPGESLMAISRTYNIKVASLIAWNNIKNPDKIEVCQKIWLMKPPANAPTTTPKEVGKAWQNPAQNGRIVQDQSLYWDQPQPVSSGGVSPVLHSTAPAVAPTNTDYWGQIAGSSRPVMIHVVQRGETLNGLARNYGYTEDRFRRMNGIALNGDYRLVEGQQIIVSDCEYDVNSAAPTTIISNPPGTTPKASKMYSTNPTYIPTGQNPAAPGSNVPLTYYAPSTVAPQPTPVQPGAVPANQFTENSVMDTGKEGNYTPPSAQRNVAPATYGTPSATQPVNTYGQQQPTSPAALREYIVQQGETVRSIAIKFKVNETELSVTNGLSVNETLIPGKRLLIPRN